jgi:hypothetical protein
VLVLEFMSGRRRAPRSCVAATADQVAAPAGAPRQPATTSVFGSGALLELVQSAASTARALRRVRAAVRAIEAGPSRRGTARATATSWRASRRRRVQADRLQCSGNNGCFGSARLERVEPGDSRPSSAILRPAAARQGARLWGLRKYGWTPGLIRTASRDRLTLAWACRIRPRRRDCARLTTSRATRPPGMSFAAARSVPPLGDRKGDMGKCGDRPRSTATPPGRATGRQGPARAASATTGLRRPWSYVEEPSGEAAARTGGCASNGRAGCRGRWAGRTSGRAPRPEPGTGLHRHPPAGAAGGDASSSSTASRRVAHSAAGGKA